MNLNDQRVTLETGFTTAMSIAIPGLLMIGENADSDPALESEWLRMSITVLDTYYPCIGLDHEITDAIFNVQIFTRLGTGASRASIIADAAKSALRGKNYGLTIAVSSFDTSVGAVEADWFSLILRATYRAQA